MAMRSFSDAACAWFGILIKRGQGVPRSWSLRRRRLQDRGSPTNPVFDSTATGPKSPKPHPAHGDSLVHAAGWCSHRLWNGASFEHFAVQGGGLIDHPFDAKFSFDHFAGGAADGLGLRPIVQ